MRHRHATTICSGLTALALVAAACGSGDGADSTATADEPAAEEPVASADEHADDQSPQPEPEPEPEPEPAGPATFTSDDGALTVTDPSGGTDITIDPTNGLDVEAPVLALASYDLGPDGATFDTPVVVEFVVAESDRGNRAFNVVHELDDGTIVEVDWEATDTGLRFELDSFSNAHIRGLELGDVILDAPGSIVEGESFPAALTLTGQLPAGVESRSSGFSASGDLTYADGQFSCPESETGLGVAEFSGDVTLVGLGAFALLSGITTATNVVCFDQVERPEPTDSRRLDRATGEPVADPLTLDPNIGFRTGDGVLVAEVTYPSDSVATLAVGGSSPDGTDFRYVELDSDGTVNAWHGSFFSFTPLGNPANIAEDDNGDGTSTARFELELPCAEPAGYRTFLGGTDMDGEPVDPMLGMLVDVTVFLETPDRIQDTFFFDPTSQPILDSMAFTTCP